MRGEVLHYDEGQGFGFIAGVDGNRYSFAREDLRGEATVAGGAEVEFQPSGDKARNVSPPRERPVIPAIGHGPARGAIHRRMDEAPARFGRAGSEPAQSTGLWSYFQRGMTRDYLNFSGRARRKEFWGFCLFWTIGFLLLLGIGLSADFSRGDFEGGGGEPLLTFGLVGLFFLLTALPWIALLVRRLHDLGLTGWLAIICFLPYIGWIATLVFGLLPTQAVDNKWGPVPFGAAG